MSKETGQTLNTQTLIGYTDLRGYAWHYRLELQGKESNHYPGAIPLADVKRRLFNWTAELTPVTYNIPVDSTENATGIDEYGEPVKTLTDNSRVVVYRSDTGAVLGVHGENYVPHQYEETLLNTTAAIITPDNLAITSDSLAIASAGLLSGGARAWLQIETPETITTPEGFQFRPFISAATSLDGSLRSTWITGKQSIVCDNTLTWALNSASSSYGVRHTKNSIAKVIDARNALGILVQSAESFSEDVKKLCETTITDKQWFAFLDELAPIPEDEGIAKTKAENKRDKLADLWINDERASTWKGTALGLMQVANTYHHHLRPVYKDTNRGERNMSDFLTGKTSKVDTEALNAVQKVLALA